MGMTTEVGLIIAFLLGVLCYMETNLAVMLTIVVTVILAVKKSVHSLIEKISEEELLDSLKFGLIALVVLPLLPNRTIDPLDVLNLYKIWLLVVFISGIGFVGYILMKVFGAQSGAGLTGIMGGVVSSTAVTVVMSHRSRESSHFVSRFVCHHYSTCDNVSENSLGGFCGESGAALSITVSYGCHDGYWCGSFCVLLEQEDSFKDRCGCKRSF
jgi:uncharacterized membrane protein (DUF4010 family)